MNICLRSLEKRRCIEMGITYIFNNRELTSLERRLRDDRKCIACGVKVHRSVTKNKATGKIYESQPFECSECAKTRLNQVFKTDGYAPGASRASLHHELKRRGLREGNGAD
jgi:hypothetical protein